MRQYSFLGESLKQFLKRLDRYTPEEQSAIMSRLVAIGKENGGKHSATEYGRRMYIGQMKRLSDNASKNGRRVGTVTTFDRNSWGAAPNKLMSDDYIRNQLIDRAHDPKALSIASSGKDLVVVPGYHKDYSLQLADAANHEADEYHEILRWARKRRISPEEVVLRSDQQEALHTPGRVMSKEQDRSKRLSTMYQFEPFHNRSVPEYKGSNVPLTDKPLEPKYQTWLDSSLKIHRFYNQ